MQEEPVSSPSAQATDWRQGGALHLATKTLPGVSPYFSLVTFFAHSLHRGVYMISQSTPPCARRRAWVGWASPNPVAKILPGVPPLLLNFEFFCLGLFPVAPPCAVPPNQWGDSSMGEYYMAGVREEDALWNYQCRGHLLY